MVKKFAILNCFKSSLAESESAQRIVETAKKIGVEVGIFTNIKKVEEFKPDFILPFSFHDPKLNAIPTYGLMTQPIKYCIGSSANIRNILTYDGYVTVSNDVRNWLEDITFGARKNTPIAFYANTIGETEFPGIDYSKPSLAYFGTNWDGERHGRLFPILSSKPYMRIYGPPEKWGHINQGAMKGKLPFDGKAVLTAYQGAGVGLCINRKEFMDSQLPTNRIFEITASGAVAICGRDPWIEEHFGDTVLYVDMEKDISTLSADIDAHMKWIAGNPAKAKEIAQKAHNIFLEKFTLEKMLQNLFVFHEEVLATHGLIKTDERSDDPEVSVVVRTGGRPAWMLERCISSLAKQTYGKITTLLVVHSPQEGIDDLEEKYPDINFRIIDTPGAKHATALWTGFRHVKTEYFAILDDDDEVFPNHFFTLFNTLRRYNKAKNWYGEVRLAYSGSVERKHKGFYDERLPEPDLMIPRLSPARLKLFEFFQTQNYLSTEFPLGTCCVLMKSDLLDEETLREPRLSIGEDLYFFNLMCEKTFFAFTGHLTAQIHTHEYGQTGFTTDMDGWVGSRMSITFSTWGRSFPSMGTLLQFRPNV
ncbi:MAG: glycosyltransferase [Rhodospirillales bacterium]|nr:glycosyltransferase [Rhodospirillales bacterium]